MTDHSTTGEHGVELLPCPFCGRESLLYAEPFDDGEQTVVRCVVCNADGPHYGDKESTSVQEAARLWNRRTPDPAIARLIDVEDMILGNASGADYDALEAALSAIKKEPNHVEG